ncbi:hypothetical protein BDZ94DRAFT_1235760 [Collybia nuda]|uniref:Uncharacterized protein n=1 Tax=Collybia nuda TaxID=64659 RepID=A0A9P6CJ23_9AGAR|nr:hypothetical protein BDZ94DRAFT_1235760 [Collybia nuda]
MFFSANGSVRKRPRQASDSPSQIPDPHVQGDWGCHPMHDTMVHFSGCGVCHAYLNHLAEAEHEPSFQNAVKVRDRLRDAYFHDGVSEGRRRQRDDDDYVYQDRERYRKERNDALEAISRYRIESHDSREELQMVTEHLRASQAESDRLRQSIEVLNRENEELANKLQAKQAISHHFVESPPPSLKLEICPAPPLVLLKNEAPSVPEPSRVPTSYAAVASSGASPTAYTTSASGQRVVHLPTRSNNSAPSPKLSATPVPPARTSFPNNPKTIRQLHALMTAAHQPGNEAALSRVKVLCSEAHATPREQKTELQRVLLSTWRNPTPGGGVPPSIVTSTPPLRTPVRPGGHSPSTIKMNPRVDDPVEVWYEYLCTHQASWPRGVRRDARNKPILADLKASRTVARLRPEADPAGNTAPRAEFMACVVDLFSTPGAYQNRIETTNFKVAPATTIRPYRGPAAIAVEDVVRHLADCGITFDAATKELEPWAQNYRTSMPS